MFSKLGASAIKKDITNTIKLCERLNNPQARFKTIHVAGTNGKGSVSHMLAAVLQQAGYKTGLYTSPHLRDFRERIRINGEMISEASVVEFVQTIQSTIEEIEPSFFEVTVAMAFQHFYKEQVDVAIIEVGLGGRLDSTNIISPLLSIITNIGYDHTDILGTTLPEIASEKAGIIKSNTPVVIGERHPETKAVFIKKAKDNSSEICFAEDEWRVEVIQDDLSDSLNLKVTQLSTSQVLQLKLDLKGTYQVKNVRTVLSAIELLKAEGFNLTAKHIEEGLSQVTSLTGLIGRWQTLGTNPLIICDTGHNEHGIREVIKNIASTNFKHLHMVIGMVKDKDITKVLSLLPVNARYYFCEPDINRAKPAEDLAKEAEAFDLKGNFYTSVKEAFDAAKDEAEGDDMIFLGGSTFVVAEIV
jgi:dihydrofolate synthase/folylpolyglutamate synthase